jgi:uroporphyrinogen decarboxylase
MRQAGRYLPEYRDLRENHSFHEVVETPELAREVTMQPMRRFELDAAIIFSDILVIPEAMGQGYSFPEGGGIEMEFAVEDESDLERLSTDGIADSLSHVGEALELVRSDLGDERALVGFAGSPWTLATYMIEGESARKKTAARLAYYNDRDMLDGLLEKVTTALEAYLDLQIEAGVDAIQLFDSWGGVLTPEAYREASAQWMEQLVDHVDGRVPVIVFSKGMHHLPNMLASTGADVVGIDWRARLDEVAARLPTNVAVQGNLDPCLMSADDPDVVEREARALLERLAGRPGFIANLGHGILPSAHPANVERFVETVVDFAS